MLSEAKHLSFISIVPVSTTDLRFFASLRMTLLTMLVAEQTFLVTATCIPFVPGLPKLVLWLKRMFH